MNKLTILLTLVVIAMSSLDGFCKETWHIVTDQGEKIPVSAIDYIVQGVYSPGFDIVLAGDDNVVKGVMKSTFTMAEDAGVSAVAEDAGYLTFSDNEIVVKGLKVASGIDIFSTSGHKVLTVRADADATNVIDLSGLQPGIYVIRTERSSVKFVKK